MNDKEMTYKLFKLGAAIHKLRLSELTNEQMDMMQHVDRAFVAVVNHHIPKREVPDTEELDINVEREACHFCGGNNQPIHPQSDTQYGEPVCTVCFVKSYIPDP